MIHWYYLIIIFLGINSFWLLIIYRKEKKFRHCFEEATATVGKMITGEKKIRLSAEGETQVHKLFHEINTLSSVLNAHADNKSKAGRYLKQTVEDISHQLKTPLAALNIYIGILQDEQTDTKTHKYFLDLAEKELERMELLVQNFLRLARFDTGNIEFNPQSEAAEDMLLELLERFIIRAEQEQKKLIIKSEDITCFCDRYWTLEALGNLVKNALDHTKAGDEITLRCTQIGAETLFQIADTGKGIGEDDLYRIFIRFYRSPKSSDHSGAGLGLPLTKTIVESQNGLIEVESTHGKGSVFSVYLPIPTKL